MVMPHGKPGFNHCRTDVYSDIKTHNFKKNILCYYIQILPSKSSKSSSESQFDLWFFDIFSDLIAYKQVIRNYPSFHTHSQMKWPSQDPETWCSSITTICKWTNSLKWKKNLNPSWFASCCELTVAEWGQTALNDTTFFCNTYSTQVWLLLQLFDLSGFYPWMSLCSNGAQYWIPDCLCTKTNDSFSTSDAIQWWGIGFESEG